MAALSAEPGNGMAHYGLGQVAEQALLYSDARYHYGLAYSRLGSNPDVKNEIEAALSRVGAKAEQAPEALQPAATPAAQHEQASPARRAYIPNPQPTATLEPELAWGYSPQPAATPAIPSAQHEQASPARRVYIPNPQPTATSAAQRARESRAANPWGNSSQPAVTPAAQHEPSPAAVATGPVTLWGAGLDGAKLAVDYHYEGEMPVKMQLTEGRHHFFVQPPNGNAFTVDREIHFDGQGIAISVELVR